MRKIYNIIILLTLFNLANGQVGIGTNNPKATLDIVALNPKSTTETKADGILIPRLSKAQVQALNNTVESTLIFVNDLNAEQLQEQESTKDINESGFYYFKNNKWNKTRESNSVRSINNQKIIATINKQYDQQLPIKEQYEDVNLKESPISGIGYENNIRIDADSINIHLPPNKYFKLTGNIALRGSDLNNNSDNPLYITSKFEIDSESKTIVSFMGYTEASSEVTNDGGNADPFIYLKTGSDGCKVKLMARYGGSQARNKGYIGGANAENTISTYIHIEEIN